MKHHSTNVPNLLLFERQVRLIFTRELYFGGAIKGEQRLHLRLRFGVVLDRGFRDNFWWNPSDRFEINFSRLLIFQFALFTMLFFLSIFLWSSQFTSVSVKSHKTVVVNNYVSYTIQSPTVLVHPLRLTSYVEVRNWGFVGMYRRLLRSRWKERKDSP